ncbi:MAG: hypothetical protein K5978_04925, partial [Campylobacter sp.]|nr:hypothetical protein [Campylobacter sp.]
MRVFVFLFAFLAFLNAQNLNIKAYFFSGKNFTNPIAENLLDKDNDLYRSYFNKVFEQYKHKPSTPIYDDKNRNYYLGATHIFFAFSDRDIVLKNGKERIPEPLAVMGNHEPAGGWYSARYEGYLLLDKISNYKFNLQTKKANANFKLFDENNFELINIWNIGSESLDFKPNSTQDLKDSFDNKKIHKYRYEIEMSAEGSGANLYLQWLVGDKLENTPGYNQNFDPSEELSFLPNDELPNPNFKVIPPNYFVSAWDTHYRVVEKEFFDSQKGKTDFDWLFNSPLRTKISHDKSWYCLLAGDLKNSKFKKLDNNDEKIIGIYYFNDKQGSTLLKTLSVKTGECFEYFHDHSSKEVFFVDDPGVNSNIISDVFAVRPYEYEFDILDENKDEVDSNKSIKSLVAGKNYILNVSSRGKTKSLDAAYSSKLTGGEILRNGESIKFNGLYPMLKDKKCAKTDSIPINQIEFDKGIAKIEHLNYDDAMKFMINLIDNTYTKVDFDKNDENADKYGLECEDYIVRKDAYKNLSKEDADMLQKSLIGCYIGLDDTNTIK